MLKYCTCQVASSQAYIYLKHAPPPPPTHTHSVHDLDSYVHCQWNSGISTAQRASEGGQAETKERLAIFSQYCLFGTLPCYLLSLYARPPPPAFSHSELSRYGMAYGHVWRLAWLGVGLIVLLIKRFIHRATPSNTQLLHARLHAPVFNDTNDLAWLLVQSI